MLISSQLYNNNISIKHYPNIKHVIHIDIDVTHIINKRTSEKQNNNIITHFLYGSNFGCFHTPL
jgi:uncharacterized protein YqfA (UPF0365 family)